MAVFYGCKSLWYYGFMAVSKSLAVERRFQVNLEVGKHLMLLGNLAAGALVFGQVVSGMPFKAIIALAGILTLGVLYTIAVLIMKRGVK